ncbi:MAG: CoA-transferase [Candidatus Alcyoniella australis]|nr:CoA-transferase [Candidatus Alcyoniella australis]
MAAYNSMELMICVAARFLQDGKIATIGTGAPCAAAMLAQKTHAPNLVMMFEAGGVAPILPTMPVSVGDSRTYYRGLMATSMRDVMATMARGMVDYCFLGGAQIDAYGNINSTMIGDDYDDPKVRLPGSGGANDLASMAWHSMVLTVHDKRRFVEKMYFVTTPGYLDGPGARERAGLPPDSGPYKVITDLAVMGYNADTCRMQVESLHPGVDMEQVQANTSFEIKSAPQITQTEPPTARDLEILRTEVDPHRYIIGR